MKSILCAIKLYLIVDAGLWYTHLSHVEYGPTATSFAALPFHQRCLTVYFFGAAGYATIYVQYTLLSIVCVMSGFSEPKRWPDLFGKWRDAYTIRRIWGYVFHSVCIELFIWLHPFSMVWHQILRRVSMVDHPTCSQYLLHISNSRAGCRRLLRPPFDFLAALGYHPMCNSSWALDSPLAFTFWATSPPAQTSLTLLHSSSSCSLSQSCLRTSSSRRSTVVGTLRSPLG